VAHWYGQFTGLPAGVREEKFFIDLDPNEER
jgi:hypothetical protein